MFPLVLLAALPLLQPFEAVEPHMGTLVRIKLYAPGRASAEAAFRAAFARIRQLDNILSDYKPDSELNLLSREYGHPVRVSADLFAVLAVSQDIAAKSGGAFDVTLGPLTRLWREARLEGKPPGPAAIEASRSRCGYRKLKLSPVDRTVTLSEPGMQLDAGGIGKGYAADQALAAIRKLGIRSALVAASGDLAFGDPPPGKSGWTIDAAALPEPAVLANAAVSTSGPDEQHLDAGGSRYSHILDPTTGAGLTANGQVTVIAPRGVLADALSTAICVLGREAGEKLARQFTGVTVWYSYKQP